MAYFQVNPSYANPKLTKRVYDLRTQGETFHHIAGIIFTEFNLKITDPTIKNIYERYVAKNMVVQGAKEGKLAEEIIPDFQAKMELRFNKIAKVTDDLMDTLTELKKDMPAMMYIKFVPTILMVSREILNQLIFIKKEQSQILVNQKNLIYSPLQIMNIVNQEIVKLEKEGKIEIKETAISGRVLTDQEKKELKNNLTFVKIKTEEEIMLEQEKKKKAIVLDTEGSGT